MIRIIYLLVTLSIALSEVYDGLTLVTNMGGGQNSGGNQSWYSHLIDNDHNIINSWTHTSSPASIAYLTSDSILYVPCKINQTGGGPSGGRFKKIDWNGNTIWDYTLPNDICNPHHDIEILPNGNILAICSETKTQSEANLAGRQNINGPMTLDMIIEIEPIGSSDANIVWRWHFWDHLVQDINPFNLNYGVVSENPQLLDINVESNGAGGNGGAGITDWNHLNCISYNPIHRQIVISSRHMNEFYVIDHSTSIEEASSHTGGNYNEGGDFLYRWGNLNSYTDLNSQPLNAPHGVNWIPLEFPGGGNFILFNNNHTSGNSAVLEIQPPMDQDGYYQLNESGYWGPSTFNWIYQPSGLYSNSQSGAFRVANGNTVVTSSNQQSVFEINQNGEVQWTYVGELGTARAIKYPKDFLEDNQTIGDLNSDSQVNILDVALIVELILSNSYSPSADINSDSSNDIIDIVLLVDLILL